MTVPVTRGYMATHGNSRASRSNPSVAFGGNSYNSRAYSSGSIRKGGGNRQFAFASHPGWSHGQEYYWQGHHYEWFNNGWFIVDPLTFQAGNYYGPYAADSDTDTVPVQVQQDLAHDGYYHGPIDGVVGPGTSAAIAAYQRDNNLPITGTISPSLLDSL